VPEGRRIFANLSVRENLQMGAYLLPALEAEGMERVFGLFPRLKERLGQAGGTLSGGEQQMLAIGRALMAGPKLLLLDEPSLGLAPRLVAEIFAVLGRLRTEGVTILLVEQMATQALALADRAYVLERGRVSLEGAASTVRENPEVIRAYLGRAGLHA
jgi:branched-chain amino acid transport system ATP-binding protein